MFLPAMAPSKAGRTAPNKHQLVSSLNRNSDDVDSSGSDFYCRRQPRFLMPSFDMFRNQTAIQSFAAGDTIFRQGDPRSFMFVVNEGEVEIKVGNRAVETVKTSGIFGEMAMIDGGPRTATAVARTDCKLVPIDQKRFQFLIQQTPFFAIEVMRVLAGRLRKVDELIAA